MDPRRRDYHFGFNNGLSFQNWDRNFASATTVPNFGNPNQFVTTVPDGVNQARHLSSATSVPNSTLDDYNLHEDCDFSDAILGYINQILMEEDVGDRNCMLHDSLDFQATEKSFYDAIGMTYPTSEDVDIDCPSSQDHGYRLHGADPSENYSGPANVGFNDDNLNYLSGHPRWASESRNSASEVESLNQRSQSASSNSISNVADRFVDSPISTLQNLDLCSDNQSISSLFIKGAEEASRLISDCNDLISNLQTNQMISMKLEEPHHQVPENNGERREDLSNNVTTTKGKKHLHGESTDLVEEDGQRSTKQVALGSSESSIRTELFDKVLLFHARDQNEAVNSLRETLQSTVSNNNKAQQKDGSNNLDDNTSYGRGRGRRRRGRTKEVFDLRTLLISCAQAVSTGDSRRAHDLLIQIRKHSSPYGDGNQRLAACLADGLEARLAGTGSWIYKSIVSKRTTASDVLKAHLLYLAACPFRKVSNYFSNKSIAKLTRTAARIHIIDFGILYGFQWPTFIQRQSMRPNGPPKIRITGIDFPQAGFRPAERVEETGRRLANYAEEFKVPFEFNSIAKKWESIEVEDFKLDEGEVVVVNCLYRMKNLPDETVAVDSPRNAVLKLMRRVNPALFILGVVNGAYSAPFFVTRFREAVFHFSSHFDMLDTVVPRDYEERVLIERDILGKEALNVVACESWERVERPETYKQWQVRNLKVGFMQLPLDLEIKGQAVEKVAPYHKDFLIDEDSKWLLLGWKGRTMYALSTWRPR